MMSSAFICLLALISLTFAMPKGPENLKSKRGYGMVGGQSADIKDYPYTAAVYSDYIQSLLGAAAIVNKYWVVCSAYELMGVTPIIVNVRVGSSNGGQGGQAVNVTKIILHSKFSSDYPYDIALVKTMVPLELGETANVVKLANASPAPGAKALVTGFGKSEDKSANQLDLKVAEVEVLSQDDCKKAHPSLGETSFCADSDGVGPCKSDIGSPLVNDNQLVGFYIGGDTCNFHGKPEVYTDVAVLSQWIKDEIKNNSNEEEMEGFADD